MKTSFLIISVILLHFHCSAQYSDEFKQIIQYQTCTTLIDSVKNNWAFNKQKNSYQSKYTPSKQTTEQINLPCIKGIKKEDIKILFGEPHQDGNWFIYYTSPANKNGFADSYLTIQFNQQGRLEKITETNSRATMNFSDTRTPDSFRTKYIKKNWKNLWKYMDTLNYYQIKIPIQNTQLLEQAFFGADTIKIKKKFGQPSERINPTEWKYYNSNYYRENKYAGEALKILFKDGIVEKISWDYGIPLIQKE